jgi:hypothetical protein
MHPNIPGLIRVPVLGECLLLQKRKAMQNVFLLKLPLSFPLSHAGALILFSLIVLGTYPLSALIERMSS